MKKLILIILLISFIHLVYAEIEYETVFNDIVPENGNFTAGNQVFNIVTVSNEIAKITFPSGIGRVIRVGDCTDQDGYNLCLTIEEGDFNISAQKYELIPKVLLQEPKTDLSITRNFEKTTFLKGEAIKVEIIITNAGSYGITGAAYKETLPEGMMITATLDCSKQGNYIYWKGSINIGKEKKFSYSIKPASDGSFNLNGVFSYDSKNETLTQEITVISIQPITEAVIPETIELGQETNVSISFFNNNSGYNISNLRYKIYLPEGIKKTANTGKVEHIANYYLYSTNLEKSSNSTIILAIRPEKLGFFEIKEVVDYKVNGISNQMTKLNYVNISAKELILNIKKQKPYEKGKSARITVDIINPSSKQTYKDISIEANSPLLSSDKKIMITQLNPNQAKNAFTLEFVVPEYAQNMTINLNYRTLFGQDIAKKEIVTMEREDMRSEDIESEEININEIDNEYLENESTEAQNSSNSGIPLLSPPGQIITNTSSKIDTVKDSFIVKNLFKIPFMITVLFAILSFTILAIWNVKKAKQETIEDKIKKTK